MTMATHPLPFMSALIVSGDDAGDFLQGQLCGDIAHLASGQSRFTGWCNAQGRVIATFLLCRHQDTWYLFLPRDLLAEVSHRLRMYVLRARVTISEPDPTLVCHGLSGAEAIAAWPTAQAPIAHLPQGATPRAFVLPESVSDTDDAATIDWQRQDIEAGLPWIVRATSEQFLPQEIGLETLGGVSYNKGCYPGQEIIARLHFRSQPKYGLFRIEASRMNDLPAPGTRLTPSDAREASGTVLLSVADNKPGTAHLLAVIRLTDAISGCHRIDQGAVSGLTLTPVFHRPLD